MDSNIAKMLSFSQLVGNNDAFFSPTNSRVQMLIAPVIPGTIMET